MARSVISDTENTIGRPPVFLDSLLVLTTHQTCMIWWPCHLCMLRTTHVHSAGTFTLSNLGMFGVDRFDAILPPGTVRWTIYFILHFYFHAMLRTLLKYVGYWKKGAIMAVGASEPTVVGTKDGRIGIKNQMQVSFLCLVELVLSHQLFFVWWISFYLIW